MSSLPVLRDALLKNICKYGYLRTNEAIRLSSGKTSNYYLDCKKCLLRAEIIPLVGEIFSRLLDDDVMFVGGPGVGSLLITLPTAIYSGRSAFFVREEPKSHGTKNILEGCLHYGGKTALVDDVFTTGGSLSKISGVMREANAEITQVIVLVDRSEKGIGILRKTYPKANIHSIFSISEIEEYLADKVVL